MQHNYVRRLRTQLTQAKKDQYQGVAQSLIETIIDAKTELGDPITAESIQDAINNLPKLRDRYLDTRWSKPVGHNHTLSQLEVFTRRYTESYLHKISASLWPALKKAESELK